MTNLTSNDLYLLALGDNAGLKCPCSRYGHSESCAWWAVAAAYVSLDANGPTDEVSLLDGLVSQAVNDTAGIGELVADNRHAVPADVLAHLDSDELDRGMVRALAGRGEDVAPVAFNMDLANGPTAMRFCQAAADLLGVAFKDRGDDVDDMAEEWTERLEASGYVVRWDAGDVVVWDCSTLSDAGREQFSELVC